MTTAVAAGAATVLIALTTAMGGDYPGPPCSGCDYAGPPIDALTHLDLGRFFASQPYMGSFSLVLRWPAALLAHGDLLWQYRLGALMCLLGPLALGLALRRRMTRPLHQLAVLGLCVANPLTFASLHWGHPEEPLAAALCVGAVLMAGERRLGIAGLLLGLALATKPWAWLAVPPVLLAAPERRTALFAMSAGVASALMLPMLLGDPSRFLHQVHGMGVAGAGVTPFNIWWGYAHQSGTISDGGAGQSAFAISPTLGAIAHPLVVAVALAASVLFWRRRPSPDISSALQLLALLFLARCLLDPLAISYHHVPFLLALIASGAMSAKRLPWLSLAIVAVTLFMTTLHDLDLLSRVYLSWTLPTALYLCLQLFRVAQTDGTLQAREDRAWQGRGDAIVLGTWRPR